MMLFLFKLLISVIALLAACVLLPQFSLGVLRVVLRSVGWVIRKRSQARREAILARVRADEEDLLKKQPKVVPASATPADDEDWEKVDTASSGDSSGSASQQGSDDWAGVIGFFHPFCNAGGGGERVLWEALRATQRRWPKAVCAIYTGDLDVTKQALLERVHNRFNINLHAPTVELLYLTTRKYVQSSMYPYVTLLGQSLGSLIVGYDAFNLLVPDIFVDTMGYAFTIAFCKLLFPSVPTGAYVHYPTISTDMLQSLDDTTGLKGVNAGAGTGLKGFLKRNYWLAFAKIYGWVGSHVDVVMCNSSWTSAHIRHIWGPSRQGSLLAPQSLKYKDPVVVFPPTAVKDIQSTTPITLETETTRTPTLLYIAQFRPEKNHPLILRSFARFLERRKSNSNTKSAGGDPQLVLIGTVRPSSPDETHIYNLRLLAHELRLRNNTTFLCDASWPTILSSLKTSSIGVNAMWNEHFGICVVEYQAAGLIAVTHDSGGPREDIVIDLPAAESEEGGGGGAGPTGFRATTEDEFADAFEKALSLSLDERISMRRRAQRSSLRFTEEEFSRKWVGEVGKLVGMVGGDA
ncbi:hypothetical protein BDV19DRAFT_377706 [Aspergillus venezuelensis]